ncbi:hypothetical protein [Burkholderia stagnalis]|uniref:hypothetical protein n=1 Tax=Burkholderia stagnalis TaxID=1503054 RepID=UPI0012DAF63E|nr:hypothetical protein [Burkholderia stagnalis]
MKHKSTEAKQENAVEVQGSAEVAVNTRVNGTFKLHLKKLAVATSLGLAALAASLPQPLAFKRPLDNAGAFVWGQTKLLRRIVKGLHAIGT